MKRFIGLKNALKNENRGFSLVELVVVIAIMVVLIGALVPNLVKYLKNAEVISAKNTSATIYRAAETYVISMTAEGVDFPPNSQLTPSVLWTPPVDLMDPVKGNNTIEIQINDLGNAVEYVYYETENGIKADYPEGFSPHDTSNDN